MKEENELLVAENSPQPLELGKSLLQKLNPLIGWQISDGMKQKVLDFEIQQELMICEHEYEELMSLDQSEVAFVNSLTVDFPKQIPTLGCVVALIGCADFPSLFYQ